MLIPLFVVSYFSSLAKVDQPFSPKIHLPKWEVIGNGI
jgi:hypothetical protein